MKISEQKIVQLLEADSASANQGDIPVYQTIYNVLKQAIVTHDLPNNCELPPTRKLSLELGVSRSTLVKVYELLRLEGILISKAGSGHIVHYEEAEDVNALTKSSDASLAEISELGKSFFGNVKLVNTLDDSSIAFRPGLPPLDIFPVTQWKKQINKYWQFIKASELSYHSEAGVEPLRKSIANYLNLTRNVKCEHGQVFIVGGSLQSLFLIGSFMLNPGDGVFMENPTFPNVHSVFRGLRANISGINLDAEGIDIESAKRRKAKNTKLIHVTPSCQYPMGMQMSAARRKEVVDFASQKGLYIIENDYEPEINHHRSATTPLFSLDKENRTFYIGTFNRILHPSIRLGFMVVPKHLVAPMKALVRHSHLFVSPSLQYTLNSFIDNKFLHKHVAKLLEVSAERHALVQKILSEKAQHLLTPIPFNVPSLHLTALLKEKTADQKVVSALAEKGIIAHSLSKCFVEGEKQQGLILGHSCIRPQQIPKELNTLISTMSGTRVIGV
jgi:GntR family transcriptional regulator/MocR family aminotransferase